MIFFFVSNSDRWVCIGGGGKGHFLGGAGMYCREGGPRVGGACREGFGQDLPLVSNDDILLAMNSSQPA